MSSLPLFGPRGASASEGFWTVSALTAQIKDVLEDEFGEVNLVGEVSNLSRPRSGHLYFNLKDDRASIRAVMWKSVAARVVFDLADGMAVRVRGAITVYETRGEYQIQVKSIQPEGIGALELAFRQMFERLQAEGLFDPDRKRPLPRYPRRIVVVTSPTGAAVRDFLQVVGRRWRAAEVLIAPAKMQGLGAADEIVAAIELANRVKGADLIVLARGGGSLEDLWSFNEEPVARAIFTSRLPVISAVGHEVDVTIADHVADFRALTPSEAGERCVPDERELRAVVGRLAERLARGLQAEVQERRLKLERASDRLASAGRDLVRSMGDDLDELSDRAREAMRDHLERRRHQLAELAGRLDALSPIAVLGRGYSLTLAEDRATVLRDVVSARPGDRIVTRLARGTLVSRVESVEPMTGSQIPSE